MSLKEILRGKIDEKKLNFVPKSFDVIGSKEKAVAIVEIPKELEDEKKKIAEAIVALNKNVKSVLRKASARTGKFRTREYELIVGSSNTEVLHKEFGYTLKVDPQKVYFSPREATERQKIAEQVKPNETVALFFAGIGAYGIAIAKKQSTVKKIISIEISPAAVNYMKENIRINKVAHLIIAIKGDVSKGAKKFFGKCNRVILPLPLEAKNFLDLAIKCLKPNGILHYYTISDETFESAEKELEALKSFNKTYKIVGKRLVLPYSPRKWKVCLDVKIK